MDKGQSKRKRADEESIERASTSSSISPEAISVGSGQYDVFLSFRGPDTRNAFTDCLYHSLIKAGTVPCQVFKDDNDIPIGEEFGSKIFDAIARSKISIPIISEDYASSKWCLLELIHIMNRRKSTSHIVLPIFYKVSATDVRHLTGKFGDAFRWSPKRFDEKDIQQAQRALNEVSYLSGWESEKIDKGREGKLIELVVKTVLSKLQKYFQLVVPGQLVGLDGQLEKIMDWILSPSVNARMIGIYGMGGIGKTTLAKCVHNKVLDKFVEASFLPDIREKATQHHGIENLQGQLIFDILHRKINVFRIDDGINIIKSGFRGKKVLILLDDIDNKKQLDALAGKHNWFMAGSMIIVTTRNQTILDQCGFEVVYKYEMKEINEVDSLLLFNRHAFHMDHSPRDFEGISRDITSTMGGLPLALEVVGSYLYSYKNKKVWEDVQKQLKDILHLKDQPYGDVLKILRISYDALDDGLKQIFLDIACFLIDKESEYAIYMWEDCGLYPNRGLEELKLRCLIKIDDDGLFKMHDQLRDLGRSIFRQRLEKSSIPGDYDYEGFPRALINPERRPWFHDFLGAASRGDSKFSEVRWLEWDVRRNDASLSTINFHLPKLSVLCLWGDIAENWEGWNSFRASKQLKVLSLGWCPNSRCTPEVILLDRGVFGNDASPSTINLHLPKLSVLELRGKGITENWEGWNSLKAMTTLKVLCLGWCPYLRCTPDLSAFTQLKILRLRHCYILEHLHPSIGKLTSLVILDLFGCRGLKELPKEVGGLKDLEELLLGYSGITAIPSSIGSLRKLKTLSAQSCKSLREIPRSIGDLQKLQCLNLKGCEELRSLPELPSGLTHLWVTCQSLGLPQLFSLIHLEELSLDVLHLLEDINELSSIPVKLCFEERDKLTSLCLDGPTYLEELSIEKCSSIKYLTLSRLFHLKIFRAEHCNSLVQIRSHDDLVCLEVIFLYDCDSIRSLLCPRSRYLKKLVAVECDNLVEIQALDGAEFLEELDFTGCKSMETLPDLTGCEKLRSLRVRDCKKLTQLQGLEKLNLIDLDISGCDSLEAIPKLSGLNVFRNYEQELSFDSWSDAS